MKEKNKTKKGRESEVLGVVGQEKEGKVKGGKGARWSKGVKRRK